MVWLGTVGSKVQVVVVVRSRAWKHSTAAKSKVRAEIQLTTFRATGPVPLKQLFTDINMMTGFKV